MRKIGIFGGSFDPVHFGHLRPALEILGALVLDEIRFLPAGQSPLRAAPVAPPGLRLRMLKAALRGEPRFVVDERELKRPGPSYTVDTLVDLHHEFPRACLVLIVGMDAFLGFPEWHEWQRIFEYAHVVVAHRPGWSPPATGKLADTLRERRADPAAGLFAAPAGWVLLQPVTQLEISSTHIRAMAAAGRDLRYLVPEPVCELIRDSHCYAQAVER
ncbi:MAG: nicotinate-nucleotide adenylyltransferase [Gammaproteobacteria bacterium]|nr:nicotinate-nucleotide adenylyltransferase [Gammaproteobacteria bacterium]